MSRGTFAIVLYKVLATMVSTAIHAIVAKIKRCAYEV